MVLPAPFEWRVPGIHVRPVAGCPLPSPSYDGSVVQWTGRGHVQDASAVWSLQDEYERWSRERTAEDEQLLLLFTYFNLEESSYDGDSG